MNSLHKNLNKGYKFIFCKKNEGFAKVVLVLTFYKGSTVQDYWGTGKGKSANRLKVHFDRFRKGDNSSSCGIIPPTRHIPVSRDPPPHRQV